MRVYAILSKSKSDTGLYLPYITAIRQYLDVVDNLYDADVALLMGAWSYRLSRVASRARRVGVPCVMIPLGDLSAWNRTHPHSSRFLQRWFYQAGMARKSECLIATTPMEKENLLALSWNEDVRLVRYPLYTRMTNDQLMTDGLRVISESVLQTFEERREAQVAGMTDNAICRQILRISLRMPHRNIPKGYLDQLHAMLRADDYDEDVLAAEMDKLRLSPFAAALFHVMREQTGLTEGFMPIPDKKGKLVKRIQGYLRDADDKSAPYI